MDLHLVTNDRDAVLGYAVTAAFNDKEIYCIGLLDSGMWGVWPYKDDGAKIPVDEVRFILPDGEVTRLT
jgi:hypothetical protein